MQNQIPYKYVKTDKYGKVAPISLMLVCIWIRCLDADGRIINVEYWHLASYHDGYLVFHDITDNEIKRNSELFTQYELSEFKVI